MAIIGAAVLLRRRAARPAPGPRRAAVRRRRWRRSPSAGRCSTSAPWSPAPARTPGTRTRAANGLDPRSMSATSTPRPVYLLVGADDRPARPRAARRRRPLRTAATALLAVECAQGLIGYTQYFLDVPAGLVVLPHARRGAHRGGSRVGRRLHAGTPADPLRGSGRNGADAFLLPPPRDVGVGARRRPEDASWRSRARQAIGEFRPPSRCPGNNTR